MLRAAGYDLPVLLDSQVVDEKVPLSRTGSVTSSTARSTASTTASESCPLLDDRPRRRNTVGVYHYNTFV